MAGEVVLLPIRTFGSEGVEIGPIGNQVPAHGTRIPRFAHAVQFIHLLTPAVVDQHLHLHDVHHTHHEQVVLAIPVR